ncbi:MAG: NAD(+) kinase [Pseudomonadota bacterium]
MTTIGLVGRPGNPGARESVLGVLDFISSRGLKAAIEADTAAGIPLPADATRLPREALGRHCDLVVVVGGDGSLLGVSREVAAAGVPVVGINRGGLGFLAAISPDQLRHELDLVLAGECHVEERFLLQAEIHRSGELVWSSNALNDVVVHAGTMARIMELSLRINDEFVYDQRSDGLIVSSPTGSTAYALSAGGPIMHPDLDAIAVVPMFPHTLTARPIVVPGDARLDVTLGPPGDATPQVSCDSQVDADLQPDDRVRISKYPHPLRMIFPRGHSFYESCRSKLDWGSRLGGGS